MSYKYFERKHVWITGASSGIGAGLAKELTKAGAIVSLSARREKEILDLIATIEKSGGKAHCFPLDITDSKAIVETHKKIISEVGPIDIVIANAGVGQSGVKAVDLTIEKVERMVDTNLTGAIMTIVACLPDMVARKSGHVVGISSLASYRGMPGSSVYSAVKAGLNIFLESVRIENIHNGISVTEICPGFVDTPILNGTTQPTPGKIPLSKAVTEIMNAMVAKKRHHGFPWIMEHILMNITVWMPAWVYEKAVWMFRK